MSSFLLAVCEIIAIFCLSSTCEGKPGMLLNQDESQKNAQELWEEAIVAKGGRQRLYQVQNLVVSRGSKNRNVGFYVFPDRFWSWADDRPTPIGLAVEMYNLRRNLAYLTYPDDPKSPRRLEALSQGQASIAEAQTLYLMETSWLKPRPIKLSKGRYRDESVDIVHTLVNGKTVGFALDRRTHLPKSILFYSSSNEEEVYYSVAFSDYAEVNGIQMPQKVNYQDTSFLHQTYQINVEYDEKLFERPPTVEAGPDAWRPTKSTGYREPGAQAQQGKSEAADIESRIQGLEGEEEGVRDEAVEFLVKIGAAAMPSLIQALKSRKAYARMAAARAISEIEPESKVPVQTLISLLKDKGGDPLLRRHSAYVMGLSAPGVLALTELLTDGDTFVRRSAAFAFEELTETKMNAPPSVLSAIKASIPGLVEALKDEDEIVRGLAAEALEQVGASAVPYLTRTLRSEDKKLRTAAAAVLRQINRGTNQ